MGAPVQWRWRAWLAAAAVCLVGAIPGWAALGQMTLVMFDEPGCPYCEAWEREVGGIYAKTDEGRQAPLLRVDIANQASVPGLASPVRFTPTFVLMVGETERGRIDGYPGDAHFWGLLEVLLRDARSVEAE